MTVKEIKDKKQWDSFVTSQSRHTFLHSWAWGELNERMGDKVWRLGLFSAKGQEGEDLVAVALVIKVHAKRGNFLFVPHGPVFAETKQRRVRSADAALRATRPSLTASTQNEHAVVLRTLSAYLEELGKKENASFIRISPLLAKTEQNEGVFKELGYRDAPIYMHAETTWTLDLKGKSEEDLMAGMRKNTRNLVRRAMRDGVEVVVGTQDEYIDEFYKLYKATAQKHGFVPFSRKYVKEEINAFAPDGARVYLGRWQGKTLSSAVIPFYGDSAFYHHGANSLEHTKVPSAYLVQWAAILEAKRRGLAHYNFWGIAPDEKDKSHPWHGLTFFKKGFGGERTDYLHAQDLVLNKKYWVNWGVEKARLWKRGV